MADPIVPDFWPYLVQNLAADVSAEVAPDFQNILAIVAQGGAVALLQPDNSLTAMAFVMKLEADALKTGNDLSKQVATWISLWVQAKFQSAPTKIKL